MNSKTHPPFEAYPFEGERDTSVGRMPTPYLTYDGHGLLIVGTAEMGKIAEVLITENVHPIQTTGGRAVLGIWVVDFTQASLGPHHELQFSLLVSHQPVPPTKNHPLTFLKTLLANPQARMFSYRLWNNTETAVAYNRELLGLNAQLSQGTIRRAGGTKTFHFMDDTGGLLFAGRVREDRRPSPRVALALFRLLGLLQTIRAFSQPFLGAIVVNPISAAFPYNGDAQSYLASDPPIIQFFDAGTDEISFGQGEAARFDFQPHFVEHFAPFRFVYLQPEKLS